LWLVATLLGVATLAVLAHPIWLPAVADVLIVEDSLEPSAGIVVLAGHVPFRAMEAAQLYRAGWAPRLVVVRGALQEEGLAVKALGIRVVEGWETEHAILTHLGVPPAAIVVTKDEAYGTLEELGAAARALQAHGVPVILVTSKVHARRVRLTWQHVTGGRSRPVVRLARQDPFDPERWWQERRAVFAVVREYLGLLNYWAGFSVAPRAAEDADSRSGRRAPPW